MFGNWSAIPVSGTAEGLTQIQKYSGPLTFPRYTTKPSSAQTPLRVPANADSRSIYAYFAAIKRATDVTQEHLDVLNVSVEYDVDVEQLLDGTDAWFPVDSDEVWSERKRELEIENTVANEVMGRIRRDVKLGHMYKFFQSVEMVAPYYGTPEEVVAEAAKKAAEDLNPKSKETVLTIGSPSPANDVDKMEIDSTEPESNGNGKRPASEPALGTAKRDRATPETDPIAPLDGEAILKTKKKEKFSMPERFRDDLVKNFVEPICWGHGVRV